MKTQRALSFAVLAIALAGCQDAALGPIPAGDPALAKGGPTQSQNTDFTITDAGLSLQSDGRGIYRNDVCGVAGWWDGVGGQLALAGVKISRSQLAACGGIRRTASVTLALRHLSDDPHVDESPSPTVWNVVNVKWGTGGNNTTTINAGNNGTPICGTLGLRFTTITYPGSSDTVREDLGGGLFHLYTRPWPDNKAYCENGGVVAFWHVSFDLYAQVLN